MFYLILFLGLVSVAAGVFVIGFGVPIRETVFGSGLLLSGTVAITAGFILVGLAATVREMRRVGQALKTRPAGAPRPLRPGERKEGSDKRPTAPRAALPIRPAAEARPPAPPPAPAEAEPAIAAPTAGSPVPVPKPAPEWIKRAMADLAAGPVAVEPEPAAHEEFLGIEAARPPQEVVPAPQPRPAPEVRSAPEPRPVQNARSAQDAWLRPAEPPTFPSPDVAPPAPPPTASPHNIFDIVWPSDRRRPAPGGAPMPEPEIEAARPPSRPPEGRSAELRPSDVRPSPAPPTPPLSIAPAPVRADPRPLSILKSGVIDEMAYTLFTDGSIEAQMPDGTMRFASIDELRQHLEKHEG